MNSVLITGSNRGLGLEWARQYALDGWKVYATCRYPEQADALNLLAQTHDNMTVSQLDVTYPEQLKRLTAEFDGTPIDVLINNAGIYREHWGKDVLGKIKYKDWQDTFDVNTLGPMRVSEALMDNVASSGRRLIIAITSHMGSITDITSPNDYAYRSSKAALNAAMKGLSLEVAERGVGVLLLHPGWVRTRMGGESAPSSAQESVAGMRRLVEGFTTASSGHFYRYDGSEIPW
jgi:NAD(P)-dependent dehydrogenase (short-subunit alcohol dehydrogenase family)